MKTFKKLFIGVACLLTLGLPLAMKDNIMQVYAEGEAPSETSSTEVIPPSEETPSEDSSSEETPIPTPEPTPFEKQKYVRKADSTHYQELTLETETDFTMLYVDDVANYSVVGTYTIEGNIITLTSDNEGLKDNKLVLNYNGTFGVYVPSVDSGEYNVADYISYLFSQAWFYAPALVTILIAVVIPMITTIVKVTSNSKTNNRASRKMVSKTNEVVNLATNMTAYMNGSIEDDLIYYKNLRSTLVNKKQIAMVDQRIQVLENRRDAIGKFAPIVEMKADELNKKILKQEAKEQKKAEKVKVRVKIVDGE